jgi:hypothetical protein
VVTVDRKTIVAAVATALMISSAALAQGACMNDLQMLTSRSTAGRGKVHDACAVHFVGLGRQAREGMLNRLG